MDFEFKRAHCRVFLDLILFIYLFVYLWLHWVFVAVRGLSLVVVRGLLLAVASLVAEHGLQVRRLQ